jgi:alpha-tubulin suppressor-like RCC1 family protein
MTKARRRDGRVGSRSLPVVPAICCLLIACGDTLAPVAEVVASAESLDLVMGDSVALSAYAAGSDGKPIPDRRVVWASNDPRVVRISEQGVVVALGAGTTSLTAESGGRRVEIPVRAVAAFSLVTTGLAHTCAVTDRGLGACWGRNASGELGEGTRYGSASPAWAPTGASVGGIAAGASHSCALGETGDIYCWGANQSAQLGLGAPDDVPHVAAQTIGGGGHFISLSAGDRHTCALASTGQAFCWGGGAGGQLGVGAPPDFCPSADEPCAVRPQPVAGTATYVVLDAGAEHTCALDGEGRAYCWGWNESGMLGDGTTVSRDTPVPVATDLRFAAITAGLSHTCALTAGGTAYCWGDNGIGQLGTTTVGWSSSPVAVGAGLTFTAISAGDAHTCAIATDGTGYCWGANEWGELGVGSRTSSATPAPIAGAERFRSVSAGAYHTCGIATSGTLFCWGWNASGQLGAGSGFFATQPVRVLGQG